MLLDWVTVTVPWECWGEQYRGIYERFERIQRYRPDSGEVVWETTAWESVRSDSHQVVCRATGQGLSFQGSPARVVGRGDAVFGEGPVRALDLRELHAILLGTADETAQALSAMRRGVAGVGAPRIGARTAGAPLPPSSNTGGKSPGKGKAKG